MTLSGAQVVYSEPVFLPLSINVTVPPTPPRNPRLGHSSSNAAFFLSSFCLTITANNPGECYLLRVQGNGRQHGD